MFHVESRKSLTEVALGQKTKTRRGGIERGQRRPSTADTDAGVRE